VAGGIFLSVAGNPPVFCWQVRRELPVSTGCSPANITEVLVLQDNVNIS